MSDDNVNNPNNGGNTNPPPKPAYIPEPEKETLTTPSGRELNIDKIKEPDNITPIDPDRITSNGNFNSDKGDFSYLDNIKPIVEYRGNMSINSRNHSDRNPDDYQSPYKTSKNFYDDEDDDLGGGIGVDGDDDPDFDPDYDGGFTNPTPTYDDYQDNDFAHSDGYDYDYDINDDGYSSKLNQSSTRQSQHGNVKMSYTIDNDGNIRKLDDEHEQKWKNRIVKPVLEKAR